MEIFLIKSYCELGITSQEVNPKSISMMLNLEPNNSYTKGDSFSSKHTERVGKRFQNLWVIRSNTIITEKEDITSHLKYFRSLLSGKLDILSELKSNPIYDLSFWIWIETNNAGIGIDLLNDDLLFLNSISNRLHLSIITNHNIKNLYKIL